MESIGIKFEDFSHTWSELTYAPNGASLICFVFKNEKIGGYPLGNG